MQPEVVWTPWDEPGMEHLALRQAPDGSVEAESVVLGVADGQPFTLRYRVESDASWRVRRLTVESLQGWVRVDLLADGNGNWTDPDGKTLAWLDGCIDVDIEATPFTNTLPIRRLNLERGESREIQVVYVTVPSLEVFVEPQRYTCLEQDLLYRFESLDGGFTADLPVDGDGLVLDYPGLFRRVYLQQGSRR